MGKIFVTTCKITYGEWASAECKKVQITEAQLENYAEQLKDYLLKIEINRTHSYDNSDDDRVEDSYSSWDVVRYCEIDPLNNSQHLVVEGDKVIGVVFIVRDNSQHEETCVFLFDGSVQEGMMLGYSASHSEDWTQVDTVTLVKRGQNGAPQEGSSVNFRQSKMYPSI